MPQPQRRSRQVRCEPASDQRRISPCNERTIPTLAEELSVTTWIAKAQIRLRQREDTP